MRAAQIAYAGGVALLLSLPTMASAQQRGQYLADSRWTAPCANGLGCDSASAVRFGDPRDYRWEGAAIGAGLFGIGGGLLMYDLCQSSDTASGCTGTAVLSGLFIGALGGLTGLLVGGAIDK